MYGDAQTAPDAISRGRERRAAGGQRKVRRKPREEELEAESKECDRHTARSVVVCNGRRIGFYIAGGSVDRRRWEWS